VGAVTAGLRHAPGGGTPDRRRLGMPLLGLSTSFAIVLIIGVVFGRTSPQLPPPGIRFVVKTVALGSSPAPSPPPSPSGASVRTASSLGGPSVQESPFYARPVVMLDTATLRTVTAERLSRTGQATLRAGRGSYEVCLLPPSAWQPFHAAQALSGWVCQGEEIGASARPVTFDLILAKPASQGGGQ
jgi:hypothetical protein